MINGTCEPVKGCKAGVILPLWTPVDNLSAGDQAARAIVYFVSLMFMFLGVSIIADRFMAAIEVITSKEREVTIKKPNGETAVVSVRIWNETVSNLTLMALGSSAPEILLSIIEVMGNKFNAGELGPGTIVGSAAFNLFVIIAICMYVIPDDEVRRIKHLRVFFITATWSIFAYLWMYLIISVFSYGVIDIWEGILTLLFFPATVLTAYIADRRIFFGKFLSKKYRASSHKGAMVVSEGDMELGEKSNGMGDDILFKGLDSDDAEIREFEKHRREYIEILRDLRRKNPTMEMKALEEMAEYEVMNRGPKSRAFYRIQATRKLTGGGNVIKKKMERKSSLQDLKVAVEDEDTTRVFFEPGHYTVMENIGTFQVTVSRQGGNLDSLIHVEYRTEDGTANAESDYEYAEGTLTFQPGETHKQFDITIIDDDIFEEDEHFYVRLTGIQTEDPLLKVQLANPSMATIMILDDDHAGIFHFNDKEISFSESCGEAEIKVSRTSGARGKVKIPYKTIEGTAKGNKDYIETEGELTFDNDNTEAFINVRIVDDEEYEKQETFYVELGQPKLVRTGSGEETKLLEDMSEEERIAQLGKPRLGEASRLAVHIQESMDTVDKLLKKANLSLVVGTSSWREQFVEAITVSAGDDGDEEEDAEEKLPSCMDYVMHFLTLFWKVLFAFVPPTDYWGGWLCFTFSIIGIGLLTAFIGDLAGSFGCTIGMKDSVTAISFVALGTSLPDTFASKVAAIGDKYADSSIGNVTGSNAVNVFLGIGVAWSIAAIYHAANGTKFEVNPGSLAFSVTIFIVFAIIAIIVILIRRTPAVGGELGGNPKYKVLSSCILFGLWVMYVLLSSLESYCYIKGF
ncbi:hypothetical protein CAPTEDRAFT_128764 [Capitella teleta]|uniref:Calx-beta domain-containing protein n=1 Tax=Capitella teleta TaxID=283909 RepID=R7UDJ7_CAPTE|nr:hypothetical protein CAPTEDRAFT_128764 [Capitella teleta]|eukprot:ELU04186.1 hypothetical protein CAPTEDRAFT_128764 [Capitella teleta]